MSQIDFSKIVLDLDAWGRLVATLPDGTSHAGVEPVRCFPLSDRDHSISLLDADGHEIINLPSLTVLSSNARILLERELADRDFVPVIQRIVTTSALHPPCDVDVETDRGRTRFHLESEDDCRRHGKNGVLIADSNGIRYSILDISKLDSASRRIVHRLI